MKILKRLALIVCLSMVVGSFMAWLIPSLEPWAMAMKFTVYMAIGWYADKIFDKWLPMC